MQAPAHAGIGKRACERAEQERRAGALPRPKRPCPEGLNI